MQTDDESVESSRFRRRLASSWVLQSLAVEDGYPAMSRAVELSELKPDEVAELGDDTRFRVTHPDFSSDWVLEIVDIEDPKSASTLSKDRAGAAVRHPGPPSCLSRSPPAAVEQLVYPLQNATH